MERLTRRKEDGSVYCRIEKGNSFIGRMAAIEDILGDDYDLDRLRCAVESLAEAEAANTQLDGVATTLMESNRKLAEALEAEKARADEAERERDSYKIFFNDVSSKGDCNTCVRADCKFKPRIGETTRFNCPLWSGQKEDPTC